MKVKVGDKVYDGAEEPVMAIFSEEEKQNIAKMESGIAKYCSYPIEKYTDEQIDEFMKLEGE